MGSVRDREKSSSNIKYNYRHVHKRSVFDGNTACHVKIHWLDPKSPYEVLMILMWPLHGYSKRDFQVLYIARIL